MISPAFCLMLHMEMLHSSIEIFDTNLKDKDLIFVFSLSTSTAGLVVASDCPLHQVLVFSSLL